MSNAAAVLDALVIDRPPTATAEDLRAMRAAEFGKLRDSAHFGVAALLYVYREGDANMRSIWLCSRNHAIGNIAVMPAALGVAGNGTARPDIIVAAGMGLLELSAALQVIVRARAELVSAPEVRRAHA